MKLLFVLLLSIPGCVQAAVDITLNSGGTVSITFLSADYNVSGAAQRTVAAGSSYNIIRTGSPKAFSLFAMAQNPSFTLTPLRVGDSYSKPCGHLAVKWSTSGTYVPLTTTNQLLTTGSGGTTTVVIDYRLGSNLSLDVPGTYSLTVVFTVTQP